MRSVVIVRVAASATIGQDGKAHASLEVTAEPVRFRALPVVRSGNVSPRASAQAVLRKVGV